MNREITDGKWVAAWGNAMSITDHRVETYSRDITLRYPVYCPFSGSRVRITLDNYCGTEDVTISRATILVGNRFYELSFDGNVSAQIVAGADIVSDELTADINQGTTVYVSIYLGEYTLMRSSVVALGPLCGGQYSVGEHTTDMELPIKLTRNTDVYYFFSNLSLYTDTYNRAVVCYGDSITAQDWPDYLTQMLEGQGTAIIRRATSGSRILREYDNITYESYGLKGTKRFNHEVPTDGADTVIIQQGINDIIHPVGEEVNPFRPMSDLPTVEELIDGYKWYIEQARKLGYRVYGGTLLPIEGWRTYAPFRDEIKDAFNEWIRTTDLLDGFIDFDAALRNPERPQAFLAQYDSGDHLHPSAEGYKRMAVEACKCIKKIYQ